MSKVQDKFFNAEGKFQLEAFKTSEELKAQGVLLIAMTLQDERVADEDRYKLSKLMMEVTKTQFIDPMKEFREKEKEEEQKIAEERGKQVAVFNERIKALFDEEAMREFADIAEDFIKAGLGNLVTVELIAKKDQDTNEFKAEFISNLGKARAKRSTASGGGGGGSRESSGAAAVSVAGKPKEGIKKLDGTPAEAIEKTQFESFTEAARMLGFVNDQTNMKGLNCRRLLESKGYDCEYVPAAPAPAATPAVEVPANA